jgi:hypothetical protein
LTARQIVLPFVVRSTLAWIATLIVAGVGVFWWQRSQIVHLREQVARQDNALVENQKRVADLSLLVGADRRGMDAPAARGTFAAMSGPRRGDAMRDEFRDDERRLILDQYRDVLAQLNLSPETAGRLQDLLTDRIETVLDTEEAAMRQGFAEGSAETARAVGFAVADVDREIASLVGVLNSRLLNGIPATAEPAPVVMPEPGPAPAVPAVVNVIVQAPAEPSYPDASAAPPYSYPLYSPYSYYLPAGIFIGRGGVRPFPGLPGGVQRSFRPPSVVRGSRAVTPARGRM